MLEETKEERERRKENGREGEKVGGKKEERILFLLTSFGHLLTEVLVTPPETYS